MRWRGGLSLALVAVAAALALAPAAAWGKAPPVAISKEVLALDRGPGTSVSVFEQITLARTPARPWQVPLPHGASGVAPASAHVRVADGKAVAAAGVAQAAVVYRLPGSLGSVFVQNVRLSVGKVAVLAAPGVYPGVGTGLTLHGLTRIGGKDFTMFDGGSQGPGGVVHFSLTVGDPGRPWADGLGVVLVLWLAAGAYLGSRRLMAILRGPGRAPDAA